MRPRNQSLSWNRAWNPGIRPHSGHAHCRGTLYLLIPAVTGTVTPQVSQVNAAVTRMHIWPKSLDLFCFEHVYKGKRITFKCCSTAFGVLAGLHSPCMSPPFCTTIFQQESLTNLMVLLSQSHDLSCYVSRRLLAPPTLRLLKHEDIQAYDFLQSPDLLHSPCLANVTCAWSWKLCGITPATHYLASKPSTELELHVCLSVAKMKLNPLKYTHSLF